MCAHTCQFCDAHIGAEPVGALAACAGGKRGQRSNAASVRTEVKSEEASSDVALEDATKPGCLERKKSVTSAL